MRILDFIFLSGWHRLAILVAILFMIFTLISSLSHRVLNVHVASWFVWLWRIFWALVIVELIGDLLTIQPVIFIEDRTFITQHVIYGLTLIIGAILSNLSSSNSSRETR